MESQLKQRLVGIAVIVSLAVIFLPALLDGAGMLEQQQFKQKKLEIPPPPKVERREVDLAAQAKALKNRSAQIPEFHNDFVDTSNRKAEAKTPVKQIKSQPPQKQVGGSTWIAQIGSFKDQDKAFKLRDKIRRYKLGSVFIQGVVINNTKNYRVRLGPFLYKKQAQSAAKKLLSQYKLKAVVMKHEK